MGVNSMGSVRAAVVLASTVIITRLNVQEFIFKVHHLTDVLIKWVNLNGLALNLKKTCYMVFSKRRIDLSSLQVRIDNTLIGCKTETGFLGVIVDEKLNWAGH